ncbi:ORF6C domain-containing protein [Sporosarcina sp. NPDC096371]|uniref:ORF6C domain-containing protein n=1 Tax=Sporosarcina sp. NPDC096371 TaxID=3364530 RepID=UPI003820F6ED
MSLSIIEQNNQRVLTTSQLAESFGTDNKIINRNFQRNSERYEQGKHYYALSGNELREFKGSRQIDDSLKYTSVLYLWTEKGAWLHAKSLNTDQAWDAYEMLVDEYYKIIETQPSNTKLLLQTALQQEERLDTVETEVKYLKNHMRVNGAQEQRIGANARGKVMQCLGGIESPAYKEIGKKAFSQFWRDFKKYFEIPRYGELPKGQFEESLIYIQEWSPDTALRLEIKRLNNQQHLRLVE